MKIPTTIKNRQLVQKRRGQIVVAATKLFSEKGFHKTTIAELANEAGLSYGNIYDYIGSKEDIFSLIHDYAASSAMAALRSSIRNVSSPIEKLRRIIRAEFNLMDNLSDSILLLYQESHILSKPYLHKLLSKEREHLNLIEQAIEESIKAGQLSECNVRLTANLIKSMIDSWIIKRWDLRGFADRLEAERSILGFIFNGLSSKHPSSENGNLTDCRPNVEAPFGMQGQVALLVNSGTPIGTALCQAFLKAGVRLAVYSISEIARRDNPAPCRSNSDQLRFYSKTHDGPMNPFLFKSIEKDIGHIDLYIHDLGIGRLEIGDATTTRSSKNIRSNLRSAEKIAAHLNPNSKSGLPSRIVYIAPWAWDQYEDPICYVTVKGSAIALTKSLAMQMAPSGSTVNCVVPGFLKTARPSSLQKKFSQMVQANIPVGSLGEIRDVVEAIFFFIGASAKYVTGQTLCANGGMV
jgi:NAD(P)-dependent dehydrogenase (short-subunit alcohol dehydrogenase family)/AcrR family transcriptional regulator